MNRKEKLLIHASFTISKRDVSALDMLAEALCLRNRSDVIRHLIRKEVRNIHRHPHNTEEHAKCS